MALKATARALLDCGAAALDAANVKPSLVHLVPGGEVAWDNCCESGGQLYVRVQPVTPSTQQGNCGPATISATLFLGVIRCAHSLDDNGNPPTAEEMNTDADRMLDDMELLFDAIRCCFITDRPGVTIGTWQPKGALGGCAGGEWQVTVTYPTCACPQ